MTRQPQDAPLADQVVVFVFAVCHFDGDRPTVNETGCKGLSKICDAKVGRVNLADRDFRERQGADVVQFRPARSDFVFNLCGNAERSQ